MKSVDIDGVTISVENTDRYTTDNRSIFEWAITIDEVVYSEADLKSGCGADPSETEMLETLLSFLGAAAESYRYDGMEGENSQLFPEPVVKWAAEHEDAISCEQSNVQEELDIEQERKAYAEEVRQVAYGWHGGQDSALYAFASSGLCEDAGDLLAEIDTCLALATEEEQSDLEALREFVVELKEGLSHDDQNFEAPWFNVWKGE
jgi:hypothetical protein